MRNVILIVILLIFTFSINVIFFYVSSNYRDLLSSFKTEKQLNIKNNDKIESVTNSGESVTE
jgi:flagellar basal body-associated protein FliL